MAFIIWNIGSRAPGTVLADAKKAFSSAATLGRGLWQFALGFVLLLAGALLMLSVTLVNVRREFTFLEGIAIVAGLGVEMLVGDTIRERRHFRR